MPGGNVIWPIPLTRLPQWFPGQMGVKGSDVELVLRSHSSGAVFYVDPNHPNASDSNDGTLPSAPLVTVARAIALCQPYRGDVIAVMGNNAWQYSDSSLGYALPIREEVVLNVPGVRLVGVAPAGTVGVVWEPVTAAGAGTCITVTACDCLIEGFSFQGGTKGGRAIFSSWNGVTTFGDNLIVRHCTFDSNIDIGIELDYVWFAEISDCLFASLDSYAIYANPAGTASAYCIIRDNWFIECLAGAIIVPEITQSFIVGNHIYNSNAQGGALATNQGINTSAGSGYNMVADNYLSCLLPVPANGDYNDFCSADANDAWINNHCMNGPTTTNPT